MCDKPLKQWIKNDVIKRMFCLQSYGVRTRGRAVNIFETCAGMLAAMNEYNKVSKTISHISWQKALNSWNEISANKSDHLLISGS